MAFTPGAEAWKEMKVTLEMEEIALAVFEDDGDPIRKAYIAGAEGALKAWRAAIAKAEVPS